MTENKCPECGGTTGYQFDQMARIGVKWGTKKQKILFFSDLPKNKRCLDCDCVFTVKKPDTAVKKADSQKSED